MAPLSQLINLLPTNASPVVTGVQGGKERSVGKGEGASKNSSEVAKVVGIVSSTQLSIPIVMKVDPVITTKITTRPIVNGMVIKSTSEGSSSKPKQTEADKGKGKRVVVEKLK